MQEDGTVHPAFVASSQPEEGLIPVSRLRHLDSPGVYLFASSEEYQAILADSQNRWIVEGVDSEGNDLAEFYLFPPATTGTGESFERFYNTQNGGYLFAGAVEKAAITDNPDLASVFLSETEAFAALF